MVNTKKNKTFIINLVSYLLIFLLFLLLFNKFAAANPESEKNKHYTKTNTTLKIEPLNASVNDVDFDIN
ncbi:hypothetical protein [Polaribacter sp. Q13]|uniref:hypothetical protein n=1 Tax=Polaribacter sp. Q13 TaxID=2806551 RepID=UPI00193BAD23|nr:hypothetical protein [Polaribacter sp. Q13]QVY65219.1 hypothetical protein JOP69_15945 [Polaribacter sp. Q13]